MEKFTRKLIEKAKTAKSVEELLAIAEENEVLLSLDEAKTYFAQLNPKCGELADDELDNVSGGGCSSTDNEVLAPAEPQFYAGQWVRLESPGHTSGGPVCLNPVCHRPYFRIIKKVNEEKWLIGCDTCDWTYWAPPENIVPIKIYRSY